MRECHRDRVRRINTILPEDINRGTSSRSCLVAGTSIKLHAAAVATSAISDCLPAIWSRRRAMMLLCI